ncbi:hypothetical protein G195_000890 [Phytophthora kernoviae 00238/432]|uniref:Probable transcriptional regulator ycf27 n=1 Tax=Phytophthora kernoviae 00238/432 TaxID=1284355 RepID=A0A8J4SGN7_9STRA|nr:hypothetical protein G195_000890 [Phytophthora kernoviae 00238/432]
MSDPLYQYFFGNGSNGGTDSYQGQNQQQQQSSNQLVPLGIGSGFIFDKEGYILTNQHVVQGADVIQVTLENNSKPYEAKLLGSSFDLDLAVLKIEKNSGDDAFPVAPLGDSNSTQVGEWLVAIGNPEGFEHTVTAGVLSAKERTISIPDEETGKTREYSHLLQTDASINPGNSGGPLLNLNGEVIGMNVAVSADAQGIGFAIPSSVISDAVKYLKENKEVPKEPVPFIGASLMALTPEVAKQMGTDITEGSVVASTIYQSPAYQADLRAYDIITGANGTAYSTSQDLIDFIKKQEIGSEVTLNVVRDGKKMDTMRSTILIVDDDEKIVSMLRRGLAFEGYDVQTASNGAEGLSKLIDKEPDIVVLDVMMPQIDGFEVCRRLREAGSKVPVLMLTAKDEVQSRVIGLDTGADDYLVKPFALEELLARVRALLRRKADMVDTPDNRLMYEDIILDNDSREVLRDGQRLELTAKEFELLNLFMQNPKRVLSRDLIMDKIWGYDYSGESNVLEVYIAMLRQKTEEYGGKRLIQTIRGAGYILRGDS